MVVPHVSYLSSGRVLYAWRDNHGLHCTGDLIRVSLYVVSVLDYARGGLGCRGSQKRLDSTFRMLLPIP